MSTTQTLVFQGAGPMGLGRIFRAYLQEARFAFLQALRAPAFTFPFLVLPAPLYAFFGVVMTGSSPEAMANPVIADLSFAGWCVMAVIGPAIFGVGIGIAMERDSGTLRLKRALPAPPGAHLIAKMLMSIAFAGLAVASVTAVALTMGKLTLSAGELLSLVAVMTVGAVPFCALGLFVGAFSSSGAAPALGHAVYLPCLWLSGVFMPLPEVLRPWAVIWPTFHLDQLALAAARVEEFVFIDPLMSAAVLVGFTVLFGGLALRRVTRVG
jgi:ABC-2 type transport system permease protein